MALGIVNTMSMENQFKGYLHGVDNPKATLTQSQTVDITWDDPEDILLNGAALAAWGGTLLVRSMDHVPQNRYDGTVVVNSKTRNAYSNTPYKDTNLTNGKTYYYRFFTYDTAGNYVSSKYITATPSADIVDSPSVGG